MKILWYIMALICLQQCGEKPGYDFNKKLPADSIYHMDADWSDQKKNKIQLSARRGKFQLIGFIYTTCNSICPLIVAQMRNIERKLTEKMASDLEFILVTIDPQKDTPEILDNFAKKMQLSEKWLLLNGSKENILEMANLIGIKYKKITDTEYLHSNALTLLDRNGVVLKQKASSNEDSEELIKTIRGVFYEKN